jgi:hypothetical protein
MVPQIVRQVADRDPGGDDEDCAGEPIIPGLRRLLSAWQAISMDMTTVLPVPVAMMQATRKSSVPASSALPRR